ncbi:hypothetical protein BH11MYX3_BH11MYX3_27150 [soil metagenome]
MVARALGILFALLGACRGEPTETACSCTPANTSRTRTVHEAAPMDGVSLLARLRRHRSDVAQGKNPRDIKMGDDELRFAIVEFCQPCGDWVTDRLTVDEMFPLGKLDQATRGVCMGLVLGDGTTAWGDARPQNCR